jgi:hypothetical protein
MEAEVVIIQSLPNRAFRLGADNLPERSTLGVEISPIWHGFIWKFCGIIAQAEILWIKLLCGRAERHAGAPGPRQPDA